MHSQDSDIGFQQPNMNGNHLTFQIWTKCCFRKKHDYCHLQSGRFAHLPLCCCSYLELKLLTLTHEMNSVTDGGLLNQPDEFRWLMTEIVTKKKKSFETFLIFWQETASVWVETIWVFLHSAWLWSAGANDKKNPSGINNSYLYYSRTWKAYRDISWKIDHPIHMILVSPSQYFCQGCWGTPSWSTLWKKK